MKFSFNKIILLTHKLICQWNGYFTCCFCLLTLYENLEREHCAAIVLLKLQNNNFKNRPNNPAPKSKILTTNKGILVAENCISIKFGNDTECTTKR